MVCGLAIGRLYLNQHDPLAASAVALMLREVSILRSHVTKFALHKALKLTSWLLMRGA